MAYECEKFAEASVLDLKRATDFIHYIKPAFKDSIVYAIEKSKPFDMNVVFHLMNIKEIEKQAIKQNKIVNALLQFHIADEETKFGFDSEKAMEIYAEIASLSLKNTKIDGVMGMATFTDDKKQIAQEFDVLKATFDKLSVSNSNIKEISMGMSGDYELALEKSSTMLRVGSLLFE